MLLHSIMGEASFQILISRLKGIFEYIDYSTKSKSIEINTKQKQLLLNSIILIEWICGIK